MKIVRSGNPGSHLRGKFVMSNVAFWDQDKSEKVFYTVFSPAEFSDEDISESVSESLHECAQVRMRLIKGHATRYDLSEAFQRSMESRGFQAHAADERSFGAMEPSLLLN